MPRYFWLCQDSQRYKFYEESLDCTEEISSSHIVWEFWGMTPQSYSHILRSYSLRFLSICIAFFNHSNFTWRSPQRKVKAPKSQTPRHQFRRINPSPRYQYHANQCRNQRSSPSRRSHDCTQRGWWAAARSWPEGSESAWCSPSTTPKYQRRPTLFPGIWRGCATSSSRPHCTSHQQPLSSLPMLTHVLWMTMLRTTLKFPKMYLRRWNVRG